MIKKSFSLFLLPLLVLGISLQLCLYRLPIKPPRRF